MKTAWQVIRGKEKHFCVFFDRSVTDTEMLRSVSVMAAAHYLSKVCGKESGVARFDIVMHTLTAGDNVLMYYRDSNENGKLYAAYDCGTPEELNELQGLEIVEP